METSNQSGFTLIELSIVLVIIGLIIGGVLVGQDLIKAAQIRATIQQVEKYNTEVHTFQIKYNALPGDIPAQTANSYGMNGAYLLSGTEGLGDGNGIIEDGGLGAGGINGNQFAGEISEFWAQLSWANLIDGGFGAGLTPGTGVPPTVTAATLSQYVPPAKLGSGMSFTVVSGTGDNWYVLMGIANVSNSGIYTMNPTGISSITAYTIDAKIDDGLEQSGTVIAASEVNPPGSVVSTGQPVYKAGLQYPSFSISVPQHNKCVILNSVPTYNTDASNGGNDPSCAIAFKFQ